MLIHAQKDQSSVQKIFDSGHGGARRTWIHSTDDEKYPDKSGGSQTGAAFSTTGAVDDAVLVPAAWCATGFVRSAFRIWRQCMAICQMTHV